MKPRIVGLAFALLASLFLVPGPAAILAPEAAAEPVATNEVVMLNTAFVPQEIIVLKFAEVNWTNQDSGAGGIHTVTMDDCTNPNPLDCEEPVLPKEFAPNNKDQEVFNNLGTFTYHCKYHPDAMKGTVIVVEALGNATVDVQASDENEFTPLLAEISLTQGLAWTNVGTIGHNVLFEDDEIGSVGELASGATLNTTFAAEGNYRYRCTYHSRDFSSGMVGRVTVGDVDPLFPPLISIDKPPGGEVDGVVAIEGVSKAGPGGAAITTIQIRAGETGPWSDAHVQTFSEAAQQYDWQFHWDSTVAPDGPYVIYARALSEEFPSPDPTSVSVTVDNAGGSDGGSGDATNSTHEHGDDHHDDEGGGTPGPGLWIAALAATTVVLGLRRRRP